MQKIGYKQFNYSEKAGLHRSLDFEESQKPRTCLKLSHTSRHRRRTSVA